MGIEISTQLIHASIAQVLHEIVPEAEIFDNPNQQGTPYPAWFIVHRSPTEIKREIRRYYLTYYIDIWYMIQQNITQMFDKYTVIGEQLADKLEYIPLYGYPGVVLHTFETSWSIEMTAMKYSLTIRLVCSREGAMLPKMEVIEDLQVFLKSLGKLKRIRYICTQFSDFDMGIETSQYCRVGDSVVLPFVGGIYRDGDNTRWEPLSWNVGPFGGQYGPITDDVTIDLVMGVVVGFDVCIGGTVGVGSNLGSDIVWRLSDMSKDAWHYVGPELVLGDVIVIGGDDLSRDAYEYSGPQKNLGPSPVLGGTVEPYNPFPTVSTVNSNWLTTSNGNEVTITANGTISAYNWTSGTGYNQVPYDATKTYAVRKWYDGVPTLMGNAGLEIVEQSGYIALKNNLSLSTKFAQGYYAICSSSDAMVVTVYNSSNVAYNAFKYLLDGTEYYYVLDGTQTEWTDDLASIGYSLFQEILLYTASGNKTAQGSVTSTFNGNVSSAYCYQLYTDENLTTPWAGYDYANDYELGRYVNGAWTPLVQHVDQLPSTTTSGYNYVVATVLLDLGQIWYASNYVNATAVAGVSPIIVRIYPKDQSLNYHVGYFYSNDAYSNRSDGLVNWPIYTAPGTNNLMTYFSGTTIIGLYGSAGNAVALNVNDKLTYYQQSFSWRTFRFTPSPTRSMKIRAIVFTTPKT